MSYITHNVLYICMCIHICMQAYECICMYIILCFILIQYKYGESMVKYGKVFGQLIYYGKPFK